MKQLTYVGMRKLRWLDVPEPNLQGPGEALVRPIAAARCDLDRAWMRHPLGGLLRIGLASHLVDRSCCTIMGSPPYAPPVAVGHECVAEVIAIGDDVQRVKVGQRVVVPFQIACGACPRCRSGFTSHCTAGPLPVTTYGFGPGAALHGGVIADVVRVPFADAMLVPVPDNVASEAVASASDNLIDGYRAVAPALAERPGADVLVVGGAAASVGLYAAAVALALGAQSVDYMDDSAERLTIAARLGANPIDTRGAAKRRRVAQLARRYPISVDACSDAGARGLELALRSLDVGGVCTSVGIYPRVRTAIALMPMYVNGVTLRTGITNARPSIPAVLDLVASGRLDPMPVASLVASWADADRAFLEPTTKVIVTRP